MEKAGRAETVTARNHSRQRMDIERLVNWALADQGLGWGGDRPVHDTFADLGTVIDDSSTGSHPTIALLTDDDALVVKAAIDGLPGEARVLVIQYGRAGLRPEGADEVLGEPEQMVDKRGRPRWVYDNPSNKRGQKRPMLDMLAWSTRKEAIEFDRAQWTLWREALIALIAPLNQRLETHYATGPEAPERPWELPKPVVHGLDVGRVTDPAPREQGSVVSVQQLRDAAQAPVQMRPLNWGQPTKPIRRRA